MSNQSPQRPRKSQIHPASQGQMPPREKSPSPSSFRTRTIKAQSVPSASQIFVSSHQPAQPSPTAPTNSRRSPPNSQVQRLLPTPPHPSPPETAEHRMSPQLSQPPHPQPNVNTHYPRPINRVPPQQFLSKFQNEENWQMTEELLAEIERADLQQSQNIAQPPNSYPMGYGQADSPSRDPAVERVRATEKSSPKDVDGRRQQALRESPKVRDRQPSSPSAQIQAPELRQSPAYHTPMGSPGEHPSALQNYAQYQYDASPIPKRISAPSGADGRPALSLSTQTPPLQAIHTRSPDRSLPVQEEPEDELTHLQSNNGDTRDREIWAGTEVEHHQTSPAPSSDLHPDGNSSRYDPNRSFDGRSSRAGHRDDDDETLIEPDQRDEEDGQYTPRSPSSGLPADIAQDRYQQGQFAKPGRGRSRNGVTDQLGLRGFDQALFEPHSVPRDIPPQYVEPRKRVEQQFSDPRTRAFTPQIHSDDFSSLLDHPTSAYIQAYLARSPRPDAPIPPTPHSQTSPPSPSPLISGGYDAKDLPPFSPVAPAGSPYPYPFSHVRRSQTYSGHSSRAQMPANYDLNHPSVIQEQFAKQWSMYAQNNNHGHITDSTLSPSSTPFPAPSFNPWAYWHTQRVLGGRYPDPISIRSSPSHEPVPLPRPANIGLKKKRNSADLRTQATGRKPPPRVDSTQPRDTSPEPSTSGEETAGEETHFAVVEEGAWVNGGHIDDDNDDWVDEDEDQDDEDLLELEYHPSFISSVEKRRRRWETRWDALAQAFQAADRQTDATMVLMAAPSHSNKLHMMTSRSIRRQSSTLARSPMMQAMRSGFRQLAIQRRKSRSHRSSLADRFLTPSSMSGSGSESESREEDLKRALGAALQSLNTLGGIYEQREARWVEEMHRISEDRERVELLLRQVLGENKVSTSNAVGHAI
ncbi:hypothetical protein EDD18DRAFT_1182787 [Armillaria luteobubalina]|uniref:Uncharacterized protein n=1 Tax=Armillaria luteobubalina TaxID=153913 RepID=A0AA39UK81_9AGAR|nr:hypothetical protein EDD18DRAFT_1182787 [Armillaria luteobubalina]